MKRKGADTTRLWWAIIALAAVVVVLFFVDPFTSSPESSDPLRADPDAPVVAYFRSDDVDRAEEPTPQELIDEVLGTVVDDENGSESTGPLAAPGS